MEYFFVLNWIYNLLHKLKFSLVKLMYYGVYKLPQLLAVVLTRE